MTVLQHTRNVRILNVDCLVPTVIVGAKGDMIFKAVSLERRKAAKILAANPDRKMALIRNVSKQTVYLGNDEPTAINEGFPIGPDEIMRDDFTNNAWWGFSNNKAELRIIEVS